jgi:hypothetical protein
MKCLDIYTFKHTLLSPILPPACYNMATSLSYHTQHLRPSFRRALGVLWGL